MQKQKTIAKWLAVILLLTAVVASYFIASSIIKSKNDNSPFADAIDESNSNNQQQPEPEPVYSTLPRSPETVGGISIAHVGGEGEDIPLARVDFYGKTYIFFESGSKEYDVKEQGIHIAVFKSDVLEKVVKFADSDEVFLSATPSKNGITVVSAKSGKTNLRLLDSSCNTVAEQSVTSELASVKAYTLNNALSLFAADGNYLGFFSVSASLDLTKSNYVYPLKNARIENVLRFSDSYLLVCSDAQNTFLFSYNDSNGFKLKKEFKNCNFKQLLPASSDGAPILTLLLKSQDGLEVSSVDTGGGLLSTYAAEGETDGVLFKESNNIVLLTASRKYTLCSHLELQSTKDVSIDAEILEFFPIDAETLSASLEFIAVNGSENAFVLSFSGMFCLAEYSQNAIGGAFFAKGNYKGALTNGNGAYSLLFSAKSNNGFSYMCFGGSDVFVATCNPPESAE